MCASPMPTNTLSPAGNLRLSELAPHFVQSEIRAMTVACAEVDGINMAQGVCDTDPPHPGGRSRDRRDPFRPQYLHAHGRYRCRCVRLLRRSFTASTVSA